MVVKKTVYVILFVKDKTLNKSQTLKSLKPSEREKQLKAKDEFSF